VLIPLYGFRAGDVIGLLVLAHDTQTIGEVAATLQAAAAVRVAPSPACRITWNGAELPMDRTVGEVGLSALERIDLEEVPP
jgi:hypothetical protein